MDQYTKHRQKCYEMFKNMLKPKGEFYAFCDIPPEDTFTEDNNSQDTIRVKFSLVSNEMLEYDRRYLGPDNNYDIEDYKPYYISFYVDVPADYKKFLNDNKRGTWSKASFSPLKDPQHIYSGIIEFSASPIKYFERKMYIEDSSLEETIVKEINNCYQVPVVTADVDIETKVNSILNNGSIDKTKVFKVGNGNLIELITSDNSEIMFDVGYHRYYSLANKRNQYNGSITAIKHLKPKMVILSHWDTDHIIGSAYANKDFFECIWIAPELTEKESINAKRLASYVTALSKNKPDSTGLYLAKREDQERIVVTYANSQTNVTLYMGHYMSKAKNSPSNCKGLVLKCINKRNDKDFISIFHGDVPYKCVENTLWKGTKQCNILIVPHHGAQNDTSCIKVDKNAYQKAIVCGNKKENRPNSKHAKELEDKGFKIYITEDFSDHCYQEFDLIDGS